MEYIRNSKFTDLNRSESQANVASSVHTPYSFLQIR